jgi:hypothetical protein
MDGITLKTKIHPTLLLLGGAILGGILGQF